MHVRLLLLSASTSLALGLPMGKAPATPRTELHVHLDGAMDSGLLLDVARTRNLSLPGVGVPKTIRDIDRVVDAASAFARFDVINNIIGGSREALQRLGVIFAARQAALNVSYTEVRYDPRRAARSSYDNSTLPMAEAIAAFSDGLRAGSLAHGVAVYSLLCAMRGEPPARCEEVVDAADDAQRAWRGTRAPPLGAVVGVDLAGDEWTYDNTAYVPCFRRAHRLGIATTVHAGEAADQADVASAVLEMGVARIGHGYVAAKNASLLALVRSHGVHLEACPGTALAEGSLSAIGAFAAHNLSFGVNEDDPSPYFGGCGFGCVEAIVQGCTGRPLSWEARLLCLKQHLPWQTVLHFTDAQLAKGHRDARRAAFADRYPH